MKRAGRSCSSLSFASTSRSSTQWKLPRSSLGIFTNTKATSVTSRVGLQSSSPSLYQKFHYNTPTYRAPLRSFAARRGGNPIVTVVGCSQPINSSFASRHYSTPDTQKIICTAGKKMQQDIPIEDPDMAEDIHGLPLESILKVFSHCTSPNYFLPWQMKPTTEKTGSGFILPGRKILTNAHVIADYTYITVKKFGGTQKYSAKVLGIGHDCDLALLTVVEEDFWKDVAAPLELGDVPHLQDTVAVVGYPSGGENISVTRGVVSRIEPQRYAHASNHLLAIQIDAAINPGNSGGPVLKENKVAGVAFQSLMGAENMGFIIPVPIIKHFLQDLERNGKYTGFGGIGVICQTLENKQLRRFLKLPHGTTGVLVNNVEKLSGAQGILQKDDVLISVDGQRIANDGTVPFRRRERIFFDYLLSKKFINDMCRVEYLRNGEKKEADIKLTPAQPLVPNHQYDKLPSYFIHAGLVFTPLTQPFLLEYGDDWYNTSPRKLCLKALVETMQEPDQELVILSHVLVHEINDGYQMMTNLQLLKFNGQKILNLKQLMQLVLTNTEPYLRFDFDDDLVIIVDAQAAAQAEADILKAHRVSSPMSEDLHALIAAKAVNTNNNNVEIGDSGSNK